MKIQLFFILVLGLWIESAINIYAQNTVGQTDVFERIAQQKSRKVPGLVDNLAPQLPDKAIPVDKTPMRHFVPQDKIDTQEELDKELSVMRQKYAPYLQELAPEISARPTLELEKFHWRLAQSYDEDNIKPALDGWGPWKQVTIPHYEGPVGTASSLYRTTFELSDELFNSDELFIHFQGVDYYATLYINGHRIGMHEGLFDSFEFNVKPFVHKGTNTFLLKVDNEGCPIGTTPPISTNGNFAYGTKFAACGGPGWDDPYLGWTCCPVGFGLWQRVWLEGRSRTFINDIFVQPDLSASCINVSLELASCKDTGFPQISYSLYGQNFEAVLVEDKAVPCSFSEGCTEQFISMPDSSIAKQPEVRLVKFSVPIPKKHLRYWDCETPWLYQLQVFLKEDNQIIDSRKQQFGMRSFVQSETSVPKGRFYLNGKEVRLRGANMMGNLMQCVMRKDTSQLIDDILLAKIAHNNFWRMTQQPCQKEVYDYCDKLGIMAQSDMPTFYAVPAVQRGEFLRQAGALFRMVRNHPSNCMVSYINEPMQGEKGGIKVLAIEELRLLFQETDSLSKRVNSSQPTKWADGDYLNVSEKYSDHHCYTLWYLGHCLPFHSLYQGNWTQTREGWMHGCGEYGSEGMDSEELIYKYYPKEWLPKDKNDNWNPSQISGCQSGREGFKCFIGRPRTLREWVETSRSHQKVATRLMTDAFRRDSHMNSTAIHLLIDAWPNGWTKTIMDYERKAKPAYFEFRDAQTPLAANLRPERFYFFSGDTISVDAWNCNDLSSTPSLFSCFQIEEGGKIIASGKQKAIIASSQSVFQGRISVVAPDVEKKTVVTIRYALVNKDGSVVHDASFPIEVYPKSQKGMEVENAGGRWQYLIDLTGRNNDF